MPCPNPSVFQAKFDPIRKIQETGTFVVPALAGKPFNVRRTLATLTGHASALVSGRREGAESNCRKGWNYRAIQHQYAEQRPRCRREREPLKRTDPTPVGRPQARSATDPAGTRSDQEAFAGKTI